MSLTRQAIFARAAKKLRADFQELLSVPHRHSKGVEAEELVRTFIERHIPKRYSVVPGFIIDFGDDISKQTDVIIYDALNCPLYRYSETGAIVPADNVAAVVEVKSRLDKEKLEEAFDNIEKTKSLVKNRRGGQLISVSGATRTPRDHESVGSTQTYGCLFVFESKLTLQTIAGHYAELVRRKGLGRHIDLILVLDKGIITLAVKHPLMPSWGNVFLEGFGGPNAEGAHIAVATHHLKDDSLDAFVRLLMMQLMIFREVVSHPGFDFRSMTNGGEMVVEYLTSITTETDPIARERRLDAYRLEAERILRQGRPIPDGS